MEHAQASARPFPSTGNARRADVSENDTPELTRSATARRQQVDFGHEMANRLEEITDRLAGSVPTAGNGDIPQPKYSGLIGDMSVTEAQGDILNGRLDRIVSRLSRLV